MPSLSFLQSAILLLNTISSTSALPFTSNSDALTTRQASDLPCSSVHVFLAKGGNEPYPGRQGKLAGAICYGLPSCDYEDILYYNANGSDYCAGVSEGDRNGLAQLTAYADRCPDAKLVLSGYSQGANIVGDLLGGVVSGEGRIFDECDVDPSPALDPSTSPGDKREWYSERPVVVRVANAVAVAAILLFGDVRHVANQSYNVLAGSVYDSAGSTRFPDSTTLMGRWSGIMRSYCDGQDPICATSSGGPYVVANHLSYFDVYSDEAAEWVKTIL